MDAAELERRARVVALDVIRFVEALPRTQTASVLGKQLLRCGTSVGANYRATCRSRSPAEFISKIGIATEEADECLYWLDLLVECGAGKQESAKSLICEANELVAIFTASSKTVKSRRRTSS